MLKARSLRINLAIAMSLIDSGKKAQAAPREVSKLDCQIIKNLTVYTLTS